MYDSERILGYGSAGTIVYGGLIDNRQIAVKRMLKHFTSYADTEISILISTDDHKNVVRYFKKEEDKEFIYLGLEECLCSLESIIENIKLIKPENQKKPIVIGNHEIVISNEFLKEILYGSMNGLLFLHSKGIVHRDLKPQNILVSKSLSAKLSDMGLGKIMEEGKSSFNTSALGSAGWQSAEVLKNEKRTKAVDIFSMGCIFYYVLTKGFHPFGDRQN